MCMDVWFLGLKRGQATAKYNHLNLKPEYLCESSLVLLWLTANLHSRLSLYLFNNIGFLPPLLLPPDLSLWLHHYSPSVLWHFLAYPLCSLQASWEETTRPGSSEGKAGGWPALERWRRSWREEVHWCGHQVWEPLWCSRPQWTKPQRMTGKKQIQRSPRFKTQVHVNNLFHSGNRCYWRWFVLFCVLAWLWSMKTQIWTEMSPSQHAGSALSRADQQYVASAHRPPLVCLFIIRFKCSHTHKNIHTLACTSTAWDNDLALKHIAHWLRQCLLSASHWARATNGFSGDHLKWWSYD